MVKTSIQQRVMKYAHVIHRTLECEWSEALLRGWEMHYLREMLAHGVVEFSYIKQDGTKRVARGTNCPELIPPSREPSGKQQEMIEAGVTKPNWKSIAYYDLDKETWRAFSIERFIQVQRVMAIMPVEC